jgi:hypothetical protein
VNDKTVVNLVIFSPCANGGRGESIDLSGPLHTLVTYSINGNKVRGAFHVQPQGIRGIGETTAARYIGTGVTEETFSGSFRNGVSKNSFINNFEIIGQGPHNNFLVHETMHLDINRDGIATVNHDNVSLECK